MKHRIWQTLGKREGHILFITHCRTKPLNVPKNKHLFSRPLIYPQIEISIQLLLVSVKLLIIQSNTSFTQKYKFQIIKALMH